MPGRILTTWQGPALPGSPLGCPPIQSTPCFELLLLLYPEAPDSFMTSLPLSDEGPSPRFTCYRPRGDTPLARWGTGAFQRLLTSPTRCPPPLPFNLKQFYKLAHGGVCGVAIGFRGAQDKRVEAGGAVGGGLPRETKGCLGLGIAG